LRRLQARLSVHWILPLVSISPAGLGGTFARVRNLSSCGAANFVDRPHAPCYNIRRFNQLDRIYRMNRVFHPVIPVAMVALILLEIFVAPAWQ